MFFDDLKDLRRIIANSMMEFNKEQVATEKEFAKQRIFFMQSMSRSEQKIQSLEADLRNFSTALSKEHN